MSRSVRLTLLCEDKQQRVFAHRFFKARDWNLREWKPITAPAGRGAADSFVRTEFPRQLKALREKGDEQVFLVALIDGDAAGTHQRRRQIDEACRDEGIEPPTDAERVLVCVPTWNIETWLAYLANQDVDESVSDYPRLDGRESECQPLVEALASMCKTGDLRCPAPSSLEAACSAFGRVFGSS
ncbi:hypothetical protein [Candidatus Poriferisodalis sp.]|uniref:hypothetical protein n=1 Tax=Candidatus Poriferisodalis sp. TaxID=3101277 RepID=UPI003B519E66